MFSVLIFYCHIRIALLQMNRSQEQGISTKTWNDLQPPQTFQQPPTTTSKIYTATRKQSKII